MGYRVAPVGAAAIWFGLLAANANGQAPVEQPVPVGMVKDGRLSLPTGGQVAAPDASWEWRVLAVGDTKMFMLVKPGESTRIFIMHQPGANVNDDFMRGFVDGTLRRSAKQGIQVLEPTYSRVDFPVPGSYRFEATTTVPSGATLSRVGYVLPSGHVVMSTFQGVMEPPAVRAVAASIKAVEKPPK